MSAEYVNAIQTSYQCVFSFDDPSLCTLDLRQLSQWNRQFGTSLETAGGGRRTPTSPDLEWENAGDVDQVHVRTLGWGALETKFIFQNAQASAVAIDVENVGLSLIHTKRCYKADKVLEQGTFLKDMGKCYCHHMKIL